MFLCCELSSRQRRPEEILAVGTHEGNLITVLHGSLLALGGHDLDVVVAVEEATHVELTIR